MIKMAESNHYVVYKEYEAVYLKIKSSNQLVKIGDFYGDVEKVLISPEEGYCVMAGCGIIAYLLREPFIPYEYEEKTMQWKEWYRHGEIWVEDIVLESERILSIRMEDGKEIHVDIGMVQMVIYPI